MRIVVASPPRFGNHWVKCLLGRVYDLRWKGGDKKPITRPKEFRQHVAEGKFPDGSIIHQHTRFRPNLVRVIEALPAHLVTVVRNPYDAFVSYYHWVQVRSPRSEEAAERAIERPRARMVGKPIDDPAVLDFLANGYRVQLEQGNEWLHSGRAIVVRFEELHADPVGTLTRLTDRIAPVDRAKIEAAIEACRIENMKAKRTKLAPTVRQGNVGDSKQTLGAAHLAIFRDVHGDVIRSLGYEVREGGRGADRT